MIPRLLDIEFLSLKPLNTLGGRAEIFHPWDGNFPSLGRKFSVPGTEIFRPWGKFSACLRVIVYFVLRSVLMSASVSLDLDKTGTFI